MSNQPEQIRPAHCSAAILNQGYIIELADGGPWLKQDLTWTPDWGDRGIWHELTDAELARARSLQPNAEVSEVAVADATKTCGAVLETVNGVVPVSEIKSDGREKFRDRRHAATLPAS